MEDILNRSYEQPDIRYEDLDSLRSLSKGINLSMLMAERRSYDIPIKTGDTITNMNVTIIPSDGDNGKVKEVSEETVLMKIMFCGSVMLRQKLKLWESLLRDMFLRVKGRVMNF